MKILMCDRARERRCRRSALALAIALALIAGAPAVGQEQAEGETDSIRARLGLEASRTLEREKRRSARRGAWVPTLIASAGVGFDSNIHDSPGGSVDVVRSGNSEETRRTPEQSSAFFPTAIQAELLHYFENKDRIKLTANGEFLLFTEDADELDSYEQSVRLFYAHRLTDDLKLLVNGGFDHANDHATNTEGDPLTRDFEKYTYRGSGALRWKPIERHAVRLSYGGKVRDYVETTDKNSLDWYSHGPELGWRFDVTDDLELEAGYEITFQKYDEEPASDKTGDQAGNPDEKHFYHRVDAGLEWEPMRDVELSAGYVFRAKDDRYRDYESYEDYGVELGIDWRPVAPLTLSLESRYSYRNYHHREDKKTGKELEYDRVGVDFGARYDLSKHLAFFGGYEFNYRDTNRRAGTGYRDYTIHSVLGGVTLAY